MNKFHLWLETEDGPDPEQPANRSTENFCNISVTLDDGRRYALNVWTFDFLPLARIGWPYEKNSESVPSLYVLPPDLFVERLEREIIEKAISEMIEKNEMQVEWLCIDTDD